METSSKPFRQLCQTVVAALLIFLLALLFLLVVEIYWWHPTTSSVCHVNCSINNFLSCGPVSVWALCASTPCVAALNKPGVGFLRVCASLVQQLLYKLIIVVFLLLPRWMYIPESLFSCPHNCHVLSWDLPQNRKTTSVIHVSCNRAHYFVCLFIATNLYLCLLHLSTLLQVLSCYSHLFA